MDLVDFLRARLDEDEQPCEGAQEYQSCDELSQRRVREVEAKRRIMARHHDFQGWCEGCGQDLIYRVNECPELRDLASVYAAHPDYDEAWRPQRTNVL